MMSVRMQAWGNCAQASRIPVIPLPARSTFGVTSVAPRLVTLSSSISFSHASQRVYILTKEHCSSWLNINIVPEAENGPRLAGFSGVLSPPPLCVCRRPLPPVKCQYEWMQTQVSHFCQVLYCQTLSQSAPVRNTEGIFFDAFVRTR